jgi:hypothetical protein
MKRSIAWVRLSTYLGCSLIGVTMTYRLLLIYLNFIIQIPGLMVVLDSIMLWALLGGNIILNFGLFGLWKYTPPLLDINEFDYTLLRKILVCGLFVIISIFITILFPPVTSIRLESQWIFEVLISLIWFIYYLFISIWIFLFWRFVDKNNSFDIFKSKRIFFHVLLGVTIASLWFISSIGVILFHTHLLSIEVIFVLYEVILVFFLSFQSYYFFKSTRFSFLLFG